MSDTPLPDPLDDFLQHPPTGLVQPERRRALLQQTTGLVRRRRRLRLVKSCLMTAAMVALVTGLVFTITRGVTYFREVADTPRERAQQTQVPGPPKAQVVPKDEPPAPVKEPPPAVALEWQAFDAPRAKQPALYLKAGDRYVEADRDLGSAVRCYGQAVHAAPTVEIDPNDNWLVLALKVDELERRKEK